MLIARIYETLPLLCKKCGSAMKILAHITESSVVCKILDHIGEPTESPSLAPARAPAWDDDPSIYPEPAWA